jgi:hypothetical protein
MDDSVTIPDLPTYLFTPTWGSALSWVLAFLLPLAAAVLMRQSWSTFRKGLVLLALAAVKTYAEAWLAAVDAGMVFNHVTTLYAVLLNFGIAVAGYFGLLKGTAVQRAAINSGLTDRKTINGQFRPGH